MLDCKTLTVAKPVVMTATELTIDKDTCDELCNAVVTVIWQNNGNRSGSFEPAIVVNGTRTGTGTTVTLNKGDTHTQTFNLSALTEGVYTICPDPNP